MGYYEPMVRTAGERMTKKVYIPKGKGRKGRKKPNVRWRDSEEVYMKMWC